MDAGGLGQDVGYQLTAGGQQVFQVIQDEQQVFVAQVAQQLPGYLRAGEGQVQGFGEGAFQPGRGVGGEGGQGDEVDAIQEGADVLVGDVVSNEEGQSGFADAARTKQGEQAARRIGQELVDLAQFCFAPDDVGAVGGEVVGADAAGGGDGGLEGLGFGQRLNAKLLTQQAGVGVVLAQGGVALALVG